MLLIQMSSTTHFSRRTKHINTEELYNIPKGINGCKMKINHAHYTASLARVVTVRKSVSSFCLHIVSPTWLRGLGVYGFILEILPQPLTHYHRCCLYVLLTLVSISVLLILHEFIWVCNHFIFQTTFHTVFFGC